MHISFHDCLEKTDFIEKAVSIMHSSATTQPSSSELSPAIVPVASENCIFESIAVGPMQCNCCVVADPVTREAMLVDPGGDLDQILEMIHRNRVTVVQILITHGHFDHFLAAAELQVACLTQRDGKAWQPPICLGADDLPLYQALAFQCAMFKVAPPLRALPAPDHLLCDGEVLALLDGRCIHTPGHSPGSMSFYFESKKILLSGDTLFRGSVGRSDLLGGDAQQLKQSIQKKLYVLPKDVKVYPGHGEPTTIGYEAEHNMVVRSAKSKI